MDIVRTLINQEAVNTPILNANIANIGEFPTLNVGDLLSQTAYIKDLTIDKLTVNDENSDANGESAETYEEVGFADITLDFADSNNCKYLMANHTHLTSNEDGLMAVINFDVPPMGAKLVCRYLVLDLRELSEDTVVGVTWPEAPIKWLYGMPDIQAGYFYVLAFQRFGENFIIGNVAIKVEG